MPGAKLAAIEGGATIAGETRKQETKGRLSRPCRRPYHDVDAGSSAPDVASVYYIRHVRRSNLRHSGCSTGQVEE